LTTVPSWRDHVLKHFDPQAARLTLVADPDGLLLEEDLLAAIRERGFDLIPFDDSVAFRYVYESRYRVLWDRGEDTDVVVVLRAPMADLRSLPYDLLQAGRQLSFGLGELFPNLSYPVVAALDRADLDALYQAQVTHAPDKLGDNATKGFVLRHVFEIAPEVLKTPSDLLRTLLRRHHRGLRVPALLDERLIQVLRGSGRFEGWPLEQIVSDSSAFFAFLQERWPIFLDELARRVDGDTAEPSASYDLKMPGPEHLPFDHDDVRVYIDTLFLDGHLHPVSHGESPRLAQQWVSIGVQLDPQRDLARRFDRLLTATEGSIPTASDRHQQWLAFAQRWAEVVAVRFADGDAHAQGVLERFRALQGQAEKAFMEWLGNRYAGLHDQPASPPVMVHHVPRYLARRMSSEASPARRIALIVLDGLALDQWVALRDELRATRPDFQAGESAVFAWIPTLTSVSRQSIFAGKAPIFFSSSLSTTDREGSLWTQFWSDQGLAPPEIAYTRATDDADLATVEEIASHPKVRVLGLVLAKVDRIMHGMELGTAGMHNQVRQWAREGSFARLTDVLFAQGFEVHVTADHGNIEASGIGRPAEGVVADLRGERARIYPNELLRRNVCERFPGTIEWPTLGLPGDYCPLLAPERKAFVPEGQRVVAHGGISIEEVIVPLVQIERRSP
jgi:hypothetical protein